MAILTRLVHLFKADIHGVMDQLEDQGLLLKQHLREMEGCLVDKEARLRQICLNRDQARQDNERSMNEINHLERDLEVAIQKGRDDIARLLIKKLKPLNRIQLDRNSHLDRLNHEIEALKENIDQQRLQYEHLRQQAADFFHRTVRQGENYSRPAMTVDFSFTDPSPEEIEIELLQRKEALKGGAAS